MKNIATAKQVIDHTDCEDCEHDFMFLMKDNYHSFYMPVDEVFVALQLAGNEGVIPPINEDWLCEMANNGYTIVDN